MQLARLPPGLRQGILSCLVCPERWSDACLQNASSGLPQSKADLTKPHQSASFWATFSELFPSTDWLQCCWQETLACACSPDFFKKAAQLRQAQQAIEQEMAELAQSAAQLSGYEQSRLEKLMKGEEVRSTGLLVPAACCQHAEHIPRKQ